MKHLFLALILGAFTGCAWFNTTSQSDTTPIARNTNTWVVCVGMENSQFAGPCPGSYRDATRMSALFKKYTPNVRTFISEQANKGDVASAMKTALKHADLFIFYYSGHGGSVTNFSNPAEDDGHDEYLCFYDTYMLDDEIWKILTTEYSGPMPRILCIFDACHSSTMYRECKPITFIDSMVRSCNRNKDALLQVTKYDNNIYIPGSIQVWSGCPDSNYSYGDANGGKMTNALLKHYRADKSYNELWRDIENDKDLKRYEEVQRTLIGGLFGSRPVFE